MSIAVISNSDSKSTEAVDGNLADLASKKESEDEINDSASSELDDESKDESEASESEDNESEENEKHIEKPKKQGGFQRRINKLNAKLSAKEQEADYWRQEAQKAKGQSVPNQKKANQYDESTSAKPKSDDFESHEEYIDALTDWKMEAKISDYENKKRVELARNEVQTKVKTHAERVKAFVSKHDDFHDLMEEVDDVRVSGAVQEIILDSENGPALMYELAKNRDEFERICSMTPLKAAKALGQFEAKLMSSISKEKKETIQTSKAPKPPTPIRSQSKKATAKSIYDSELSQAEYEALRKRQLSK